MKLIFKRKGDEGINRYYCLLGKIFPYLFWVSTEENFRRFSIGPSFLVYEYSKDADSTKYEILEVTRISSHLISPNKVHINAIKYKKGCFFVRNDL